MQGDYLLSRLKLLKESIDDTEDLVNIELDQRQAGPCSGSTDCEALHSQKSSPPTLYNFYHTIAPAAVRLL